MVKLRASKLRYRWSSLVFVGLLAIGCGGDDDSANGSTLDTTLPGDDASSVLDTTDDPRSRESDAQTMGDTTVAEETATPTAPVDIVEIAVSGFYPEGIHVDDNGTIFVGSVGLGAVARARAGETEASLIVEPGGLGGALTGIHRLEDNLWACLNVDSDADGQFDSPSLVAIDEQRGSVAYSVPLDGGVFCNDFVADAAGNVYVTESIFSRIYRLPVGGTALEVWFDDQGFDPPVGGFGFNGIVMDEAGTGVLVGDFSNGNLAHIAIAEDGSAGQAVWIEVSPAIVVGTPGIDGMGWSGSQLFAVRGPEVVAIDLDGEALTATATTVESPEPLNGPTTLAIGPGGDIWVAEGQLNALFDGDPTTTGVEPFRAIRIPAP